MMSNKNYFSPITIMHWNANGIIAKMTELLNFVAEHNPDFIMLNETHTKPTNKITIPNYQTYKCDRITHQGGGSAILAHRKYITSVFNISSKDNIDETSIVLQLDNSNYKLTSVYNPPKNNIKEDHVKSFFDNDYKTIVIGDLNAKNTAWGCNKTNNNGSQLYKHIKNLGLTVYAPESPTHMSQISQPDILDIMLTNITSPFAINVINDLSSDHLPLLITTNLKTANEDQITKHTDWLLFHNILYTNKDQIYIDSISEIDTEIQNVTKEINNAYEEATTVKVKTLNKFKLPSNIKDLIKIKNKVRKKYQKTLNPIYKTEYNRLNKQVKTLCQNHRMDSWNDKISSLCREDNSIWQFAKTVRNTKINNLPLKGPNGNIYLEKDKATIFKSTMAEQFSLNKDPTNPATDILVNNLYDEIINNNQTTESKNYTNDDEIINIIKHLKNNKAPGHDAINNRMIKNLPPNFVTKIKNIFNACIKYNYFPIEWKKSDIILFPKPGKDATAPANYRPISLLPTISKIFEKVLQKQMEPYLNILPKQQYGFRKHLSTTMQLININEFISSAYYKNETAAMLMLDVAKAFDRVWHKGLITKLHKYNFPSYLILIINSYLIGRSFRIKLNKTYSEYEIIEAGVPQGSILGPILYIIYTADFPINDTNTNELIALYADDTAVITKSIRHKKAIENLQLKINEIEKWCAQWKIKLHPDKSNLIIFNRRKKGKKIPDIKLYNTTINPTKDAKYLGVNINHNYTFVKHIQDTIKKAHGAYFALRCILNGKSKLSINNKRLLYVQAIRPILTYASPALTTISNNLKKQLSAAEGKIIRRMLGAPKAISNDKLRQDLNLPDINEYIAKLNTDFYNKAKNCHTSEFNKLLDIEFIDDNAKYSSVTAFMLSDCILSNRFT